MISLSAVVAVLRAKMPIVKIEDNKNTIDQRQVDVYEFKASIDYIEVPRTLIDT